MTNHLKASWHKKFDEFLTKTAYDVCVPRNQLISLPKNSLLEAALLAASKDLYSSYPVHDGENQDEIVGILHVKDILRNITGLRKKTVGDVMRPVRFIAYSETLLHIFETFQKEKLSLAIVVNQYGEMDGMLTVDDILQELVGEMPDKRVDEVLVPKKHKGKLVFDGRFPLQELNKIYSTSFPEEEIETIGGYLAYKLGRLPEVGEKVKLEDKVFMVLQKNARIITKIAIEGLKSANKTD